MADKIKKFLAKLPTKDLVAVRIILAKILANDLKGLNIVQLKGSQDVFRVKKGSLRVIFRTENGKNFIISIDRRNEKTYKNF